MHAAVTVTVLNEHVGPVHVTLHARERWSERGATEDLEAALQRAMPFGGQRGDGALLLADGDNVFATDRTECGRIVKTVLTMAQAVANMEICFGHRPHSVKPLPAVNTPIPSASRRYSQSSSPKPKRTPPDAHLETLLALYHMSDEQLDAEIAQNATGQWHQIKLREKGRRNQVKKYIEHAKRMEQEKKDLVAAMRQVVSDEQLQEVFQRQNQMQQARKEQ